MGSPEFALPTLSALAEHHSVVAALSQPDRPAGRGKLVTAPPAKLLAQELEIPVLQPERIASPTTLSEIAELNPELIVVAAYGQILSQELLDIPPMGSLNVHASLLPRWRGAAPVQAAIREGDTETGVTIMLMEAGMDTGPILSQRTTPIAEGDTGGALADRLARIGAELLIESLLPYLSGAIKPEPQDPNAATYAPMLKKQDGLLDLRKSAAYSARQIRAYDPWPGSFLLWDQRRLSIKQAYPIATDGTKSGRVSTIDGFPALATADGLLVISRILPEGRNEMSGRAFVQGAPEFLEARLLQ